MGGFGHVNPNRMELLRLKKRLALAERGHKLLKDKQEQLVRMFMALVKEVKTLRIDVEERLANAYKHYVSASMEMNYEVIEDSIAFCSRKAIVKKTLTPIMNLRVPNFETTWSDGDYNYGYVDTAGDFDIAIRKLKNLTPDLLSLSEKEKSLHMISEELTSTRRRVSALEHVFIPKLLDTIKMINSKLSELERSASVRLMKVKDIVREH